MCNNSFSQATKRQLCADSKPAVTKYANAIPFARQTRFHDRVIRDYDEHSRIARYINENIADWQNDELYNNNISHNEN